MPKVLVQAGHNPPRQPGFESGTGTPGEIEFVHDVGTKLVALLEKDGRFDVTGCPGKMPDPAWKGDVFLALHADGASPAAHGYSLGWPPAEWGPKTATMYRLLRENYERIPGHPTHHTDNYTRDMQGYYGFHHCSAAAKILIEHGFLTNPQERQWLLGNVDEIANAWYQALRQYFGLKAQRPTTDKFASPAAHPTSIAEKALYNRWVEWYLGEGEFKQSSPHAPGVRPPEWKWEAPREWLSSLLERLIEDRERTKGV